MLANNILILADDLGKPKFELRLLTLDQIQIIFSFLIMALGFLLIFNFFGDFYLFFKFIRNLVIGTFYWGPFDHLQLLSKN